MKDLHEMGVRGRLPIFMNEFLEVRTFQVQIGLTRSNHHKQEEGVPQGSIISPKTIYNKN